MGLGLTYQSIGISNEGRSGRKISRLHMVFKRINERFRKKYNGKTGSVDRASDCQFGFIVGFNSGRSAFTWDISKIYVANRFFYFSSVILVFDFIV